MSDYTSKVREVLVRAMHSREFVEIYGDEQDLDRFDVGMVESVTVDHYCIQSIGTYGEVDARQIGRIEDIVRLSTGSEYLRALRLLHDARGKLSVDLPSPEGYVPLDIYNSLRFAKDLRVIVSVTDPDHVAITGLIRDFGREFLEITEVRRDGQEDGTMVMHIDEVVRVDIGGRVEQTRAFMHRVRMGL